MIETKSKSVALDNGTKISLSVCIEADSKSFSENKQQEIISEFGIIAQLLLSELESTIGCPKRKPTFEECSDGKAIAAHYGIELDGLSKLVTFDSKDIAREFVALSFYRHGTPMQLIIDYDPDYPCSVLRKKDISIR